MFSDVVKLDVSLDQLCESDLLRQTFSTLLDKAIRGVTAAGLDLDEVVVDRFVRCRCGLNTAIDVPAEPLANVDRLITNILEACRKKYCGDIVATRVGITGLVVRAVHESWDAPD